MTDAEIRTILAAYMNKTGKTQRQVCAKAGISRERLASFMVFRRKLNDQEIEQVKEFLDGIDPGFKPQKAGS